MLISSSVLACLLASILGIAAAPQHSTVQDRGQHAMGFDQQRTTHHFIIERDGGTIEVTANDTADRASTNQIRTHLRHIASAFTQGDFSLPMFIHAAEPPGVSVMQQRRTRMSFRFKEAASGGRVVIRTSDARALESLHEFLRFQIREHQTGDPMDPR